MKVSWSASVFALAFLQPLPAHAGSGQKEPAHLAHLELTAEVAATSEEGAPSAVRVTLRNVGNVAVDMPLLRPGCHPDNGVQIGTSWTSLDGKLGGGSGGNCGTDHQPTLRQRVSTQWIRLRPGEFMTTSLQIEALPREGHTVEYWVEYIPPDATPKEVEDLLAAGYVIPTQKLETEHRSVTQR